MSMLACYLYLSTQHLCYDIRQLPWFLNYKLSILQRFGRELARYLKVRAQPLNGLWFALCKSHHYIGL